MGKKIYHLHPGESNALFFDYIKKKKILNGAVQKVPPP